MMIGIPERYCDIFSKLDRRSSLVLDISIGDVGALRKIEKRINTLAKGDGFNVFYDRKRKSAVIISRYRFRNLNKKRMKRGRIRFFYGITP